MHCPSRASVVLGATAIALATCSASEAKSTSGLAKSTIASGVKYVKGSAKKARTRLAPFTIGFVNETVGTPAFPENGAAATATVSYINSYLDGVQGHPIKLDTCVIQAEGDGQKCAAQFLANKDKIIDLGISVVGNATFYKTIAGKIPVVVNTPATGADQTTTHAYVFNGGGVALVTAQIKSAKAAGDKTVALIGPDNPAGQYYVQDVIEPLLKADRISYKASYVSDTAGTQEAEAAIPASGAAQSDAIIYTASGPAQCVSVFKGLQALDIKKPVYTSYVCTGNPFPQSTGGGANNWTFFSYGTQVRTSSPAVTNYYNVMNAGGGSQYKTVGSASLTYADFLLMTRLANQIGFKSLSPHTLEAKLSSFAGPVPLVPGQFKCGFDKALVSVCGNSVAGSTFKHGVWTETPSVKTAPFK